MYGRVQEGTKRDRIWSLTHVEIFASNTGLQKGQARAFTKVASRDVAVAWFM